MRARERELPGPVGHLDVSEATMHDSTAPQFCRHGHEYTAANTYYPPNGNRTCRACQSRWQREHRERRRAARGITLLERCQTCGDEHPSSQMHWHHRDSSTKVFDISKGHHYTAAAVEAEIAKCDRICWSCHTRLHHMRGDGRWAPTRPSPTT